MEERLKDLLERLYYFLRDYGLGVEAAEAIKRLIFALENNDIKRFKKEFKSSLIWGGAGSISDLDLKDRDKQKVLDSYLIELRELGSIFANM